MNELKRLSINAFDYCTSVSVVRIIRPAKSRDVPPPIVLFRSSCDLSELVWHLQLEASEVVSNG